MYSTNETFWDFTWEDMAKYDVPAMIYTIKAQTEKDKLFYIGYSQGAAQMFSALADPKISGGIKESLVRVIALAPCVMFNTANKDEDYYRKGLYKFREHGIHAFEGPGWFYDKKKICEEFDADVCEEY